MTLPSSTSPEAATATRSRPWEEEGRHQWRCYSRWRSSPSRCLRRQPRERSAVGACRALVRTATAAVLLLLQRAETRHPGHGVRRTGGRVGLPIVIAIKFFCYNILSYEIAIERSK
jgi:hypothetical protein